MFGKLSCQFGCKPALLNKILLNSVGWPAQSTCTLGPSVCTALLPMCHYMLINSLHLNPDPLPTFMAWFCPPSPALKPSPHPESVGWFTSTPCLTWQPAQPSIQHIQTFRCSCHVQSLIHAMPLSLHERPAMLSCHHSSKNPRVVVAFLGLAQFGHSSVASPENSPGARPWVQARLSHGWPEGFQKGWHPPAPEAESAKLYST